MKKTEIFHTIRCCGKTFTQGQWAEYCSQVSNDESKRICTQFGKYIFNECDICINPDKHEIRFDGKGHNRVEIKWAWCENGLWSYGISWCVGTAGGGYGASWVDNMTNRPWDRGYPSENECKVAACEAAVNIVERHPFSNPNDTKRFVKLINDWKRTIIHGRVVQLELF